MAKKSNSLSESFVVHASPVTERVVKSRKSNIKLYVIGGLFFLVIIALIVGLFLYEQQKLETATQNFREELSNMSKTIEINETIIEQNRKNNLERLANIQELSEEITTMQQDIDDQDGKITTVEVNIDEIEVNIDEIEVIDESGATNMEEIMNQLGTIEDKVDEQGDVIGSILILSEDSKGNENSILPGYSLLTLRNLAIQYVYAIKHFIYGEANLWEEIYPEGFEGPYDHTELMTNLRSDWGPPGGIVVGENDYNGKRYVNKEENIPETKQLTVRFPADEGYRVDYYAKRLNYNRSEMQKLIGKECYYMGECDDKGPDIHQYDREGPGDPNIPLIILAAVGTTNNDIQEKADPPFNPSYSLESHRFDDSEEVPSYLEVFKTTHDLFLDWIISDDSYPNKDLKEFLSDIITNEKVHALRVFLECILCHMYQSQGRRTRDGSGTRIEHGVSSLWLSEMEPMDLKILNFSMSEISEYSDAKLFRRYDDDPSQRAMNWHEYKFSILYSD